MYLCACIYTHTRQAMSRWSAASEIRRMQHDIAKCDMGPATLRADARPANGLIGGALARGRMSAYRVGARISPSWSLTDMRVACARDLPGLPPL